MHHCPHLEEEDPLPLPTLFQSKIVKEKQHYHA